MSVRGWPKGRSNPPTQFPSADKNRSNSSNVASSRTTASEYLQPRAVPDEAAGPFSLRPGLTDVDLAAAAEMCLSRGVGCLCVRSCDVASASRLIGGGGVAVASVVAFPHGSARWEVKALEAALAVEDGCSELDMVMNIPAFLSGRLAKDTSPPPPQDRRR